jgi:hypothetical protein
MYINSQYSCLWGLKWELKLVVITVAKCKQSRILTSKSILNLLSYTYCKNAKKMTQLRGKSVLLTLNMDTNKRL